MHCPKCGTEMQTVQTITRNAFTVRVRLCPSKACGTRFVTEEAPGDPRVYHRLMAEDVAARRQSARVHTRHEHRRLHHAV